MICGLLLAPLGVGVAQAADDAFGGDAVLWAQQNPDARGGLDREQAGRRAGQATGGRVLGVRAESGGYRVKVLDRDNRVRWVWVDGRTGQVSE